jgi:hypothetical protein
MGVRAMSEDGTQRPFQNTRSQKEWNFECVESAVFELLPCSQPSQTDPKTVTWQSVHHEAKQFDGFTGSAEFVRELLADNRLDTTHSEKVAEGYLVQRSLQAGTDRNGGTQDGE